MSHLVKKRGFWQKGKVVKKIKELYTKGIDINAVNMRDNFNPLFKAGIRNYGSWGNAVDSSGIKYVKIRKDRKTESYKGLVFQKVLWEIFKALGLPYTQGTNFTFKNERCLPDFLSKNGKIWVDAKIRSWSVGTEHTIEKYLKYIPQIEIYFIGGGPRDFGKENVKFICIKNYFDQLRKLGRIDLINKILYLEQQNKNQSQFKTWSKIWSKEKIIKKIQSLYKQNLPLNDNYAAKHYSKLRGSAIDKNYFGSWKNAIEAAGIKYDEVIKLKKSPYLNKKDVIEKLKDLKKKNLVKFKYIYQNERILYNSSIKLFGSFKKAIEAAGIDYEKDAMSHRYWSRSKIKDSLKKLEADGIHLSYGVLRKIDSALLRTLETKKYFNNLQEARIASGIKLKKKSRWQKDN